MQGIVCARGHFNDPDARFYAICGIGMVRRRRNLVSGVRPPLGVLVLDDGRDFRRRRGYVHRQRAGGVGPGPHGGGTPADDRRPEAAPVQGAHGGLLVVDWELRIEDAGSRNGTPDPPPGFFQWQQLSPEEPTPIEPGTAYRRRRPWLVFDSHFGAN